MNDIDFASSRDGNTPYVTRKNMKEVVQYWKTTHLLFQWFRENQMKANKDKLVPKTKRTSLRIDDSEQICNSEYETMLGSKVDCNLNFQEYLHSVLKKATCKVNLLLESVRYMSFLKGKKFMNAIFTS